MTRGIVDFGKGIMTIYPDSDSFHDDTDNSDNSKDDWGAILEVIDFGDIQEIDGLELPSYVKYDTHALADTGSNINVIPYGIHVKIGKGKVKPIANKIKMLDHSKAKPIGILRDVLCQVGITIILARFLILDIPVDKEVPIVVG
ncbi:DNA-directed DNA polymerase [Tanacetum coccineum]